MLPESRSEVESMVTDASEAVIPLTIPVEPSDQSVSVFVSSMPLATGGGLYDHDTLTLSSNNSSSAAIGPAVAEGSSA